MGAHVPYNLSMEKYLSKRLEKWLHSRGPKTVESLLQAFSDDSFAVILIVLMLLPAMPLPTGGVVHIFEVIAILLGLELVLGKKEVWLPQAWAQKELPPRARIRAIQFLIKILRPVEKHIRPTPEIRLSKSILDRIVGGLVVLFSSFAFIAPPFSNLDTLPAVGVVLIGLSMVCENIWIGLVGVAAGSAGIMLIIWLGQVIIHFV